MLNPERKAMPDVDTDFDIGKLRTVAELAYAVGRGKSMAVTPIRRAMLSHSVNCYCGFESRLRN